MPSSEDYYGTIQYFEEWSSLKHRTVHASQRWLKWKRRNEEKRKKKKEKRKGRQEIVTIKNGMKMHNIKVTKIENKEDCL